MKIIDIHPHIISADTERYPPTPFGGKRSKWSAERPATFEELVAGMDEAGIAKAAIVHSSTTYGYNNEYLADAIAGHAARFTGVFSVDVWAPDAPEKMRHWYSRNLTGMRIYAHNAEVSTASRLDDPRTYPAWDCARDLGISVCISVHSAKREQLVAILRRYSEVKIVIDGLPPAVIEEGPPYAAMAWLAEVAQYENVYMKLHTNAIRASRRGKASPDTFLPKLVELFGTSRIAWGSNFPASTGRLAQIVEEAQSVLSVLEVEDREWIFHRTATSVYPALAG